MSLTGFSELLKGFWENTSSLIGPGGLSLCLLGFHPPVYRGLLVDPKGGVGAL